jgi:hypothetical protein
VPRGRGECRKGTGEAARPQLLPGNPGRPRGGRFAPSLTTVAFPRSGATDLGDLGANPPGRCEASRYRSPAPVCTPRITRSLRAIPDKSLGICRETSQIPRSSFDSDARTYRPPVGTSRGAVSGSSTNTSTPMSGSTWLSLMNAIILRPITRSTSAQSASRMISCTSSRVCRTFGFAMFGQLAFASRHGVPHHDHDAVATDDGSRLCGSAPGVLAQHPDDGLRDSCLVAPACLVGLHGGPPFTRSPKAKPRAGPERGKGPTCCLPAFGIASPADWPSP